MTWDAIVGTIVICTSVTNGKTLPIRHPEPSHPYTRHKPTECRAAYVQHRLVIGGHKPMRASVK
jgi:hypothetical protein